MTAGGVFALIGLGVAVLAVAQRPDLRDAESLRDRAIAAQRRADLAAQAARELAAQWNAQKETSS